MAENQQEKLVRVLGCTEEEALDIISNDKAIDQGKRVDFDLDPEREKMAKKMANTGTKRPTVYNFDTKGKIRKENPIKEGVIARLAKFLEENSENACENVEITNKERQISFSIGSDKYELTLVQKRQPKS